MIGLFSGQIFSATFTTTSENDFKSKTLLKLFRNAENLHDNRDINFGGFYDNSHQRVERIEIEMSAGQSRLKMVRQLTRWASDFYADDVYVAINPNANDMHGAFLNQFEDEYSEPYGLAIYKYTQKVEAIAKSARHFELYSYSFGGRAYGNFAEAGFIILNTRDNEVLLVGNGWSD